MNKGFDDLLKKVSECSKKKVAVAVAQDAPVLEAVKAAKEKGIADAILVGDEEKIREIAASLHMDLADYEIVNDRGDGMLSLTYDDLISILWKVCQSLRKDNKEIKRQLSSLQNQISSQGLAIQQQSLDNQLSNINGGI